MCANAVKKMQGPLCSLRCDSWALALAGIPETPDGRDRWAMQERGSKFTIRTLQKPRREKNIHTKPLKYQTGSSFLSLPSSFLNGTLSITSFNAIDLDITLLRRFVQLGQLRMSLCHCDTRTRVQSRFFNFVSKDLRYEMDPWV